MLAGAIVPALTTLVDVVLALLEPEIDDLRKGGLTMRGLMDIPPSVLHVSF